MLYIHNRIYNKIYLKKSSSVNYYYITLVITLTMIYDLTIYKTFLNKNKRILSNCLKCACCEYLYQCHEQNQIDKSL